MQLCQNNPRLLSLRILLVEDEPLAQKVHCLMLERKGHIVDLATTGHQTLAMFGKGYDLILMDVGLPDISGIDVAAEIRRLEDDNKRTPIIALTAYVHDDIKQQCLASGMDHVTTKPISWAALQNFVYEWAKKD